MNPHPQRRKSEAHDSKAIRRARRSVLRDGMKTLQYLVLDFETTGLEELLDDIIEVAVIGTDAELNEKFRYETCIQPTALAMTRLLDNEYVLNMHKGNGLFDIVESGFEHGKAIPSLSQVDVELAKRIDLYRHVMSDGTMKRITLAGSGVSHFDARFIRALMPKLYSRINASTFDVGGFRRQYEQWNGFDLTDANESKTHRAMDDVECHLEEMRAFREVFVNHGKTAKTSTFSLNGVIT